MRGGRQSIPRALSPTAPHRILTPAFDGWLTGRQAMRRERSGAFWCHFSPGILAFVPQLHPNCCQPSELSNVPSPTPPIRASELPVRSSAWSAVPVAGLLFRATPRHMHCASGRRRLLRTPLGAHHSTMAQWRASWAFRAQGCVCAGAACVRHESAAQQPAHTKARRHRTLGVQMRPDMERNARIYATGDFPAHCPSTRPRC